MRKVEPSLTVRKVSVPRKRGTEGGVKTIEGRFSKKGIIYLYTYSRSTSDTPQK